jgi:RNA recognition motif-containing protein
MKKIYVGNLPFTTTDAELRQMFANHGTVESADVITDRYTGQSRGFGFVEMSSSDADKAIQALNGTNLGDRSLNVNEARSRGQNGSSDRRRAW